MKTSLYTFLCLLVSISLTGQQRVKSAAQATFHANEIRTVFNQGGASFWDLDHAKFQVPFENAASPSTLFAAGLWLTAEDEDGELSISGNTYNVGYTPGTVSHSKDSSYQKSIYWNKIFHVTADDILAHIEDLKDGNMDDLNENILGWPAVGNEHFEGIHGFELDLGSQGGAFFIESAGHKNGLYEPEFGEYPHVLNLSEDVVPALIQWYVYNNATEQLDRTSGLHMICEIQQVNYAFSCADDILDQTIFSQYRVTSLSESDLLDFRVAHWVDGDLGCPRDDYFGADQNLNTFYYYNADNKDEDQLNDCVGPGTYGLNPPVQAITFLNRSMEKCGGYSNPSLGGDVSRGDPETFQEYRNYTLGLWRDGTAWTSGGNGYNPGSLDTVDFLFPDNPNDPMGWSMYNNVPFDDFRTLAIISEDVLTPSESMIVDVAYSYHRKSGFDFLQNVDYALTRVEQIKKKYENKTLGCVPQICDCSCVWPGDANTDGRVDYLDAVNIIQSMTDNGPVRQNPLPYLPQDVEDWTDVSTHQINSKYADVDGNGHVDREDLNLLTSYFDNFNRCQKSPNEFCERGDEVYLDCKNYDINQFKKGVIFPGIRLKSKNTFNGFSFRLIFDADIFKIWVDTSLGQPNWSDSSVLNITTFRSFKGLQKGEIQVVMFNDRGEDVSLGKKVDNIIAEFALFAGDVPSVYHKKTVDIEICDFTLYYADGTSENLPSQKVAIPLPDDVIITDTEDNLILDVVLYPNPNNGNFNIVGEDLSGSELKLTNLSGQILYSDILKSNDNQIGIRGLKAGLYVLTIENKRGAFVQRLIVE